MKEEHHKFMGARVKDMVTEATGVVTCISYYLNGCVRLMVEPLVDKDGKRPDAFYIDVQQARITDEAPEHTTRLKQPQAPGGPQRSEAPR